MALQGTWTFGGVGWGDRHQRWLYDPCSLESVRKTRPDLGEWHFQPGGSVFERAEAAKHYRDASPIGKIDIEIAHLRSMVGYIGIGLQAGRDQKEARADIERTAARIAELKAERAKLEERAAQSAPADAAAACAAGLRSDGG
jgi:hypothetical protein